MAVRGGGVRRAEPRWASRGRRDGEPAHRAMARRPARVRRLGGRCRIRAFACLPRSSHQSRPLVASIAWGARARRRLSQAGHFLGRTRGAGRVDGGKRGPASLAGVLPGSRSQPVRPPAHHPGLDRGSGGSPSALRTTPSPRDPWSQPVRTASSSRRRSVREAAGSTRPSECSHWRSPSDRPGCCLSPDGPPQRSWGAAWRSWRVGRSFPGSLGENFRTR